MNTATQARTVTTEEHHRRLRERGFTPTGRGGRWIKEAPKGERIEPVRQIPVEAAGPEFVAPDQSAGRVVIEWGKQRVVVTLPLDTRRDDAVQGIAALLGHIITGRAQQAYGLQQYRTMTVSEIDTALGRLSELKLIESK